MEKKKVTYVRRSDDQPCNVLVACQETDTTSCPLLAAERSLEALRQKGRF